MEINRNRRLLIIVGIVMFFAVIVMIWYFFYAKPVVAPSITGTNNPIPTRQTPPRFQFLTTWGDDTVSTSTTEIFDPLKEPLIQIWKRPSTGQTFVVQDVLKSVIATTTIGTSTVEVKKMIRATSTVLLFVDRITGYAYGYAVDSGKIFQISNTVLPGIHDAYFFNNGANIMIRYINQEKNTVVGLIAKLPILQEEGIALPLENIQYLTSDVTSIAVNAKKDKLSYLVGTPNGSTVYTVTPKGASLVASSPFKEWDLSYGGDNLYATTKPSAYVEGTMFSVPSFSPVVSNKTGLMTNPGPTGTSLNSMWGSRGLVTFLSNDGDLQAIPLVTVASKCVWGSSNFLACAVPRTQLMSVEGMPDDWFQGRGTFSDDLFIVDKNTGTNSRLYTFTEEQGSFDIIGLTLTRENDLLSFNRKQDGSLWLLNRNLLKGE